MIVSEGKYMDSVVDDYATTWALIHTNFLPAACPVSNCILTLDFQLHAHGELVLRLETGMEGRDPTVPPSQILVFHVIPIIATRERGILRIFLHRRCLVGPQIQPHFKERMDLFCRTGGGKNKD